MNEEKPKGLIGKRFVILGLQGSGKSENAKYILRQYGDRAIVYDTLNEYEGFSRYVPEQNQSYPYCNLELDLFCDKYLYPNLNAYDLFVIDEANLYCPSKRPLPSSIMKINDYNRHYDLGFGVIARRATQLHTDLLELAHYLFIYRLTGVNDSKYLNAVVDGLGDEVASLQDYEFVLVLPDRTFSRQKPLSIM